MLWLSAMSNVCRLRDKVPASPTWRSLTDKMQGKQRPHITSANAVRSEGWRWCAVGVMSLCFGERTGLTAVQHLLWPRDQRNINILPKAKQQQNRQEAARMTNRQPWLPATHPESDPLTSLCGPRAARSLSSCTDSRLYRAPAALGDCKLYTNMTLWLLYRWEEKAPNTRRPPAARRFHCAAADQERLDSNGSSRADQLILSSHSSSAL